MNTLIIDALFIYSNLKNHFDKKSSLEIIFEKAKKCNFERYILLQNGRISEVPDGIKNIIINEFSLENILSIFIEEAKNTENLIIFNAGNPFFDIDFINKMIEKHEKYVADYTYGLGYPDGLLPEILRKNIIKEIVELNKDIKKISKNYIFKAISKNINSFDIETFLAEKDLRIYRLSFDASDKGNEKLVKWIYDNVDKNFDTDEILDFISNNLDSIYTTLYMMTIELTNQIQVKSIYYPEKLLETQKSISIDIELAKKIIDMSVSENNQVNIVFGGIGDPLLYENIMELTKFTIDKNVKLIIETTAAYINEKLLNDFETIINKQNLIFVVKLDAYSENIYDIIHPGANFKQTIKIIETLKNMGFSVYKQIIRMHENEIDIENYIRNKETDEIIIRKYSTYCNNLTDKKIVDLAPLQRIPCFKLRREIFVNPDGSVPACKYSRFNSKIGNFNEDNLNDVMNKLKVLYKKNVNIEYEDYCVDCNDYYLFNF